MHIFRENIEFVNISEKVFADNSEFTVFPGSMLPVGSYGKPIPVSFRLVCRQCERTGTWCWPRTSRKDTRTTSRKMKQNTSSINRLTAYDKLTDMAVKR